MRQHTLLLLIVCVTTLEAGSFSKSPGDICQWMRPERFVGGNNYKKVSDSFYRCSTHRKNINKGEPLGSNVRYIVEGTETTATSISLELQMRSFRHPQQTLREFSEYANLLATQALSVELPDSILGKLRSGLPGNWDLNGRRITLEKRHATATGYDLHFIIE